MLNKQRGNELQGGSAGTEQQIGGSVPRNKSGGSTALGVQA